MTSIILSPSTISLFLQCPRCFWLDKNKGIKRPPGIFPSLPSGMDGILKKHFDKHREENIPLEELEGKFKGKLFQDSEKLEEWRDNFKGLRYFDNETGMGLMGAIDDLFVTDDGLYAPLDFKTRGYPKKDDTAGYYQHQMDLYSFLLEKNGMKPADFAILIFYHPTGVNENHDVVFDSDAVKMSVDTRGGENLFKDACNCLLGNEPPAKLECSWCKWLKERF